MTDFIEIHWTSGSLDEARKVARYLVQEKYVACSQIIPWIESIYLWNNQLETSQESKVILKTRKELFNEVKSMIEKNCSYQVPEITSFEIQECNPLYLDWLNQTLRSIHK